MLLSSQIKIGNEKCTTYLVRHFTHCILQDSFVVWQYFIHHSFLLWTELFRLQSGSLLEVLYCKDWFDVITEVQVVYKVMEASRLVMIFKYGQLRFEETEFTQIQCTSEVVLQHPSTVELVIVVCPFMDPHAFSVYLLMTTQIWQSPLVASN